jgi:hypothetical protein
LFALRWLFEEITCALEQARDCQFGLSRFYPNQQQFEMEQEARDMAAGRKRINGKDLVFGI